MIKNQAYEKIHDLIERFINIVREEKIHQFSEADVGSKFILPFFEALGWNIKDIDEFKEQKRTLSGPADYSLEVNGKPKIVIEIKKFNEDLDNKRTIRGKEESYPEQAFRYCWWLKVDWVILTNFKETRFYYSHERKPEDGLIFKLNYDQYLENLNKLWIFSRESVISGELDIHEKRRMRNDVDKEILEDLLQCRKSLMETIRKNNPSLTISLLKESVQKILNRILIIRVAEDGGVIGADSLWKELDNWKNSGLSSLFIRRLNGLFRDFNEVYNSIIFAKHICDELKLDNDPLEKIINILYKYNFIFIPADILGAIYEDYLGHILKESETGIDIIKNQKTRKKGGIFYTPHYIVDYIVRKALAEYLNNKSLEEISKIKILDPACGSGSFLIKAFDILKEYYIEFNKKQMEKARNKMDLTIFSNIFPNIEKKILKDNIFGVDLDSQATEIAVVNLMLKALKKGEQLPELTDTNIKCGNSLIYGNEEELLKCFGENWKLERPFDWHNEFPEIFKHGGFDIIIGNPPHGAKLSKKERTFLSKKYQLTKGYKNTASLFIEQSFNLLKNQGILGLVIPKSLTYSQRWNTTRNYLLQNFQIIEIADISKAFTGVLLEQILLICKKVQKTKSHYCGTKLLFSEKPETYKIPLTLCKELDCFPIQIDSLSLKIYQKVMKKSQQFKDISNTFRGLPIQNKSSETRSEYSESLLKGADVRPYFNNEPLIFVDKKYLKKFQKKVEDLKKPKLISQRIVAHVLYPSDHIIIMSTLNQDGQLNVDTVENTILTNFNYDLRYLLAFLNSKFVSWFTYTFIFNKAVRTMDFDNYYIGKIPIYPEIKITLEQQQPFIDLVDKLIDQIKSYMEIRINFLDEVNKFPRLDDKKLEFYYSKLPSKDKQVIIRSNLEGKIKYFEVIEEDDWLIFKINYNSNEKNKTKLYKNIDVFKLKIHDKILRKFIKTSVINCKKKIGKGNILRNLLKLPIPYFDKNEEKNENVIKEIMKTFLVINEKEKELKKEIAGIEKTINQKIYELYNLDNKEMDFIEFAFGSESIILHLLT